MTSESPNSDDFEAECPEQIFDNVPDVTVSVLAPWDDIIGRRSFRFTPRLMFNQLRFFTSVQLEGSNQQDWLTYSIRRESNARLLLNRFATERGQRIVSLNNGGGFAAICTEGYNAFNISIAHSVLDEHGHLAEVDPVLLTSTTLYEPPPALHSLIISQLEEAANAPVCDHCFESAIADITATLLTALGDAEPVTSDNRLRVVNRSIEYLRQNPHHEVSVVELADHAHCSLRTLQYAFRRTTGLSPLQYIRRFRLNQFRRAMLETSAGEGSSIARTARDFGFRHASHLTNNYKTLFGELPSAGCKCGLH